MKQKQSFQPLSASNQLLKSICIKVHMNHLDFRRNCNYTPPRIDYAELRKISISVHWASNTTNVLGVQK